MNTHETYVVNDNLIVSYHDLDVKVSKAKIVLDANHTIVEARDVQIVPVRKHDEVRDAV